MAGARPDDRARGETELARAIPSEEEEDEVN